MRYRASRVALMGLLFALAIVLSWVESFFAGMIAIPGIKPGFSNIVTMYCLLCMGPREAYTLAGLKCFFVLLTRGPYGAALSLAGGMLSVTAMLLAKKITPGVLFLSICGGICHNLGQLVVVCFALGHASFFYYYFPILALSGAGMGALTGLLVRTVAPHLKRIFHS